MYMYKVLIKFLFARISEEELYWTRKWADAKDCQECAVLSDHEPGPTIEHMLADCWVKRSLVRDAGLTVLAANDDLDNERKQGGATMAEIMLCYFASVYTEHPDYDPTWLK